MMHTAPSGFIESEAGQVCRKGPAAELPARLGDERTGVLVAKIGPLGYSETFIRDHVRLLPGALPLCEGSPPRPPRLYEGIMRRAGWQGVSPRATRYWIDEFRRLSPAVVLAEHGPTAVSMLQACARLAIPLVAHFHGSDASKQGVVRGHRHSYRLLFSRATSIVVASRSMFDRLVDLGASENKLHVIRLGIDLDRVHFTPLRDGPPHFVGVGRFVEVKGHVHTIRAFASVLPARPDARLTIIGDGPLHDQCKLLVRKLGIQDHVRLPGARSHEEVIECLRTARALVHHSIRTGDGAREGASIVVAEAHAIGLPVVATPNGGIVEITTDSEDALIIPERDEEAMADAILRLANDVELARRLGAAGRARVEREQNLVKSTASLAEVLAAASGRAFDA